jgi:hypothetical protein
MKCRYTSKQLGRLYLKRKKYLINSYRLALIKVKKELMRNPEKGH